ncbi:MAG: host attachment protein [Paracoccaceae bacterium]
MADEAGFRLFHGAGEGFEEVASVRAASLDDVDHEWKGTGRNRSGSGASFGHGSAAGAEIERPRLARHVIAALQAEWDKGRADRIVIAAGPKMLGALRDALPKALAGKVAASLPKDLSDVPAHDLQGHFMGHVPP